MDGRVVELELNQLPPDVPGVVLAAIIQPIIKHSQTLKRSGDIVGGRKVLEDCYRQCMAAGISEGHMGLAPLHKSIAKLCYLQDQFELAVSRYAMAITIYKQYGNDLEVYTNMVHLGSCHPEFRRSEFYQDYIRTLMGDKSAPSMPTEVAELLHDVGKTFMARLFPNDGWS